MNHNATKYTPTKGAKKAKTKTCPQWNEFDKVKLLKLFQTEAVDLKDLSSEAIRNVLEKYFPERPYTSFAPFYKRKLRGFSINKSKTGQRKGKIIAYFCIQHILYQLTVILLAIATNTKSVSRKSITSQINFEDSEDETWRESTATTRSSSDSEDEGDYAQEYSLSDIEEHEYFDIEAESNEEVEDLIEEFQTMSVRFKSTALKFEYPHLVYPYEENRQKKFCIDLITLYFSTDNYRCAFNASGSEMLVYTRVPDIFTSKKRIMEANEDIQDNTSKAVAFEEFSEPVRDMMSIDEGLWGAAVDY